MNLQLLLAGLWTILTSVGLATTIWSLRETYRDRQSLTETGSDGAKLLIAQGAIRREIVRVIQLSLFLGMGILALAVPESDARAWFTVFGLFLAAALISINSILDGLDRQLLIQR